MHSSIWQRLTVSNEKSIKNIQCFRRVVREEIKYPRYAVPWKKRWLNKAAKKLSFFD